MNIYKKIALLSVIFSLLFVGLSGCTQEATVNDPEMEKFIGVWQASENDIQIFSADGSCWYLGIRGTYTIEGGILKVELGNDQNREYTYTFTNNDLTLTLSSTRWGTTTYHKQQ